MEICKSCPSIAEEDLRAAQAELKTYVDITEEDLMKIYVLAVRHARKRHATIVPVRSLMTAKVVAALPETSIQEAENRLSEYAISGMPVLDRDNRVIGIVSLSDIRSHRNRKNNPAKAMVRSILSTIGLIKRGEETVRDIMSKPPITTEPDADIQEAAALMEMKGIKRLPVVDPDGTIVGIISRGDIIRTIGSNHKAG